MFIHKTSLSNLIVIRPALDKSETLESTLKLLIEKENQILQEKMLNMEKKLMDQEKLTIHLSENLTEVKEKHNAEVDKNIKLEQKHHSAMDLTLEKDKHIHKLEEDIKKCVAICSKCENRQETHNLPISYKT